MTGKGSASHAHAEPLLSITLYSLLFQQCNSPLLAQRMTMRLKKVSHSIIVVFFRDSLSFWFVTLVTINKLRDLKNSPTSTDRIECDKYKVSGISPTFFKSAIARKEAKQYHYALSSSLSPPSPSHNLNLFCPTNHRQELMHVHYLARSAYRRRYHTRQATGWELAAGVQTKFTVPDDWTAGRIWVRTGCVDQDGIFQCLTGQCGSGENGDVTCKNSDQPPATLGEYPAWR